MHAALLLFALVSQTDAAAPSPASTEAGDPQLTQDLATDASGFSARYDRGLVLEAPNDWFKTKANARVQVRATTQSAEGAPRQTEMELKRARLSLKGNILTSNLTYKFQADFSKYHYELKDLYAGYAFAKHVQLKVGRLKRPFSRQHINSSGKLQLVDRAMTQKTFVIERDWGMVLGNSSKSPIEYSIGIFNGSGTKKIIAPKDGEASGVAPAVGGRLAYNHAGIDPYNETDFKGGDVRFSVGANAELNLEDDFTGWRTEADFIVKLHGFSTSGGLFLGKLEDRAHNLGAYAQAGYLVKGRVEPAFRYSAMTSLEDRANRHQILAGLAIYAFEHRLKIQVDGGPQLSSTPTDGDSTAWTARTQLQVIL